MDLDISLQREPVLYDFPTEPVFTVRPTDPAAIGTATPDGFTRWDAVRNR